MVRVSTLSFVASKSLENKNQVAESFLSAQQNPDVKPTAGPPIDGLLFDKIINSQEFKVWANDVELRFIRRLFRNKRLTRNDYALTDAKGILDSQWWTKLSTIDVPVEYNGRRFFIHGIADLSADGYGSHKHEAQSIKELVYAENQKQYNLRDLPEKENTLEFMIKIFDAAAAAEGVLVEPNPARRKQDFILKKKSQNRR